MLEPWNNLMVLPPPVNMFLSDTKIDVMALEHACNNIIRILSKQSPLHNESALCSRFLYKYDKKFRNDIGYRNLKKVHSALKKYLALNLLRDVENFLSALPSRNDDEVYLPTRQMLEYVLIRIMAFSMIMMRICVCSKQAAVFYLDRIKRGESHWMSLLPYALLSRLFSMCMVLLQHTCSWYSTLHSYLGKLQLKGVNFLPDNYELPSDLEKWMGLKDIDSFGKFEWAQKKQINVDTTLIDDDENDMLGNLLEYVNQSNGDDEVEDSKPLLGHFKDNVQFNISTISKVDQGEVLSREAFNQSKRTEERSYSHCPHIGNGKLVKNANADKGEVLSREAFKVLNTHSKITEHNKKSVEPSQKKTQTNRSEVTFNKTQSKMFNKHCHKSVTNSNSLKSFIDREDEFRNKSDTQSLTSHLSFMQWHSLKNTLLKLCVCITNRKIERKFQGIWKEKCLDYV